MHRMSVSVSGDVDVKSTQESTMTDLQLDSRDEWLDKALFDRTTDKYSSSIFNSSAMVVDHFLSPNADLMGVDNDTLLDDAQRYPLRRVQSDSDTEVESTSTTISMFSPLFGSCSKHTSQSTPRPPTADLDTFSSKKKQRINLKLTVAYRGLDFCGWEDQRHELYRSDVSGAVKQSAVEEEVLPSVQGTLVDILDPLLGKKATHHNDCKHLEQQAKYNPNFQKMTKVMPIEIKVAGRTDAGVSAISQVCRIRTYRTDIGESTNNNTGEGLEKFVQNLVNYEMQQLGEGLRIRDVERVKHDFHPTFDASCRAYVYLIDVNDDASDAITPKITRHIVPKLNSVLKTLEGKELDYLAMSYGKVKTQTTLCTLLHARAGIVEWKCNNDSESPKRKQAICIELVGDRFLRRMVRLLVATALREASGADGCDDNALLNILTSMDRTYRARAAPPDGLIFVGAGYA